MLRESRARASARRIAAATAVAGVLAVLAGVPVSADTNDNGGFEGFALGQPVGQFGWTANDVPAFAAANFDVEIVDPTSVWSGGELGTRALRVSNAVTSNGFGNQMQSTSLLDEAGETTALNGGKSGGTRQTRLSGTVTFASATKAHQPGLIFSFSPDRGDGPRMSLFRITDLPGGLKVEAGLFDTSDPLNPAFVSQTIAENLDHTQVHTLEFTIDFVDGPSNDVLWARVGGECESWSESGTWEQYHRNHAGNNPPVTFTADSLLFRLAGGAVPANAGNGILFDTFTLTSETVPAMPPIGVPGAPAEPLVFVNGDTVNVTGTAVTTNSCVPVTGYRLTVTPLSGGAPIVLTSPTPSFSFPTPGTGLWLMTLAAENDQGTGSESPEATITVVLAAEDGGGLLADSGPRDDAPVTGALAALLLLLGSGLLGLVAQRRRRVLA